MESSNFDVHKLQLALHTPISMPKNSSSSLATAAPSNHWLLTYPFKFKWHEGTLLFDTGASHTIINHSFAMLSGIPLKQSKIKGIKLANGSIAPIIGATDPFSIKLNEVQTTISGLILEQINYDVIAGID